jgi:hypothetical protein
MRYNSAHWHHLQIVWISNRENKRTRESTVLPEDLSDPRNCESGDSAAYLAASAKYNRFGKGYERRSRE